MKKPFSFAAVCAAVVVAACSTTPPPSETRIELTNETEKRLKPRLAASSEIRRLNLTAEQKATLSSPSYQRRSAKVINMRDMQTLAQQAGARTGDPVVVGGAMLESPMTDAEMVAASEFAAANAPRSSEIQNIDERRKWWARRGPRVKRVIDSIGAEDCCVDDVTFGATVPPDPDMAAGPDHLIAVVNVSFEIYDKQGRVLQPATSYGTLFAGVDPFGACEGNFPFDPDVLYDEASGQFIIGVDGGGVAYCIGITTEGDPLGEWNLYSFLTIPPPFTEFFDFPHMGIGTDAVFVGSNQFDPDFIGGAVFAVSKEELLSGGPLNVIRQDVPRFDSTPQPATNRGKAEGTLPTSGANFIMTEVFDGINHSVYAWDDPFGANNFFLVGDVDLAEASGVPCDAGSCFPVAVPQADSTVTLAGNDWRGQETEFRNGSLWTTQTISCNPTNDEVVNCVRWAEIDPEHVQPGPVDADGFLVSSTTDGVVQAGVFSSKDGAHRWFPSIAANACDEMAIGYSKSSTEIFPSIAVTGQKWWDRRGRVRRESDVIMGDEPYRSFQDPEAPNRWGDYTGMTVDPNGIDFWYIGEYAGASENEFTNWRNAIARVRLSCNKFFIKLRRRY